jgi:hypothetical protein
MKEVILAKHGTTVAPRTHLRGSVPIDGIFATESIEIVQGGYSAFDEGVTGKRVDHQCLWIDINITDVFGHSMPGPVKHSAHPVNGKDPRTINKFNAAYKEFAIRTGLSRHIFLLEQQAVYPLPAHLQLEAEAIATLHYEGVRHADHKCRKLHFGDAGYTPEFSRLEAALKTRDLLLARRLHKKAVGASIIKRQHIKSKMQTTLSKLYSMDIPTLRKAATKAYKAYRRYWDHADVSRDTWLEDLAKARAANEQVKKLRLRGKAPRVKKKCPTKSQRTAAQLRALRSEESNRRFFSRIKYAIGADQLAGISTVLAQDDEGNWQQQTKHEDITRLRNTSTNTIKRKILRP